jgi:hypothetical protein
LNPVLAWIGNVVGHYDAKENVYPRKERPENKIDGAVPGDLGDLRVTMRARVASRRDEAINRPELQPQTIRLRIAAVPGSRCPAHRIPLVMSAPDLPPPTLNFAAIFSAFH